MIMKCRVHTPEQAVLYLTDCTLATVGMMASKKAVENANIGVKSVLLKLVLTGC
jgi:hypothetical protein